MSKTTENSLFRFSDQSPVRVRVRDALPETVDVTIIGGGIISLATAWYLAKRGRKVPVCDESRISPNKSGQ